MRHSRLSYLAVAGALSLGVSQPALAINIMNTEDPIAELIEHVVRNPTSEDLKNPNSPWYSIGVVVQPSTTYVKMRNVLELNGVSVHEVAALTGNLFNDPIWYPGASSVTLIEGNGQVGTIYEETLSFLGIAFTSQVYIAGRARDHYQIDISIGGLVTSIGVLVWEPTPTGSRFTLHGLIPAPPGLDPDLLRFFLGLALHQALANVLDFFGATGTITITDQVVTTPAF